MLVKGALNEVIRDGLLKICKEEGIVRVPQEEKGLRWLLVKLGLRKQEYIELSEYQPILRGEIQSRTANIEVLDDEN